jgi:hypothetical protein
VSDRTVHLHTFRGNFTNLGAGLTTMGKGVGISALKLTALDKQGATSRRGLTSSARPPARSGWSPRPGSARSCCRPRTSTRPCRGSRRRPGPARTGWTSCGTAAIKAGADTVFSATEAADAITAMSKAGVSAKDILSGGLDGALSLASAGELDVARPRTSPPRR